MRRFAFGALVTVLALWAAPVSAQDLTSTAARPGPAWHLNAVIGPAFGTLGTIPATSASAAYELGQGWAFVGEAGTFRGASSDKAAAVAPALSSLGAGSDVNAYHVNVNMRYRVPGLGRTMPYLTAGAGTFTTSTSASSTAGGATLATSRRETHSAANLGAGLTYRLNRWLGVGADYRYFVFNTNQAQHVNRFTVGASFLIK